MSTHGIVAVGSLSEWRGIYNNSDSYPTCLGKELRSTLMEEIAGGKSLRSITENILLFDDWHNYVNGGVCPYCGKITTQPHSIGADLVAGADAEEEFPDPDCLRHSHEEMNLDELQITNETLEDDSYIEWIYVIDLTPRLIHVIDTREEYGRNLHNIPLRGSRAQFPASGVWRRLRPLCLSRFGSLL